MSPQYTFTSDWFLHNQSSWDIHLEEFKNKPNLNFLEIGSYEGRSTIWLLENVLTDPSSKITCIDLFDGTLEENNMENDPNLNLDYEKTFWNNIQPFKEKVKVFKGWSHEILRTLNLNESFDFAYIDGDHTAYGTLMDAVLIHPLIKPGGMIIFDDYGWKDPSEPSPQESPELAIDSFCYIFDKQYTVIHQGWQVIIKKK
jgi:predicted O-methyltransferase YrrM